MSKCFLVMADRPLCYLVEVSTRGVTCTYFCQHLVLEVNFDVLFPVPGLNIRAPLINRWVQGARRVATL